MSIDNLVGEVVGGVIALKMIQQISPQKRGVTRTRVVKVKIMKRKPVKAAKRKTVKKKAKK